MNYSERRQIDRFTLELQALISMVDATGKAEAFEVMTRNISAGGAFLQTDKRLETGIDVNIDLILPLDNVPQMEKKGARINVSGAVVRTEPQGMAVCFDKKYCISPLTGKKS